MTVKKIQGKPFVTTQQQVLSLQVFLTTIKSADK